MTDTTTTMPATQPDPGEAIRRYLSALRDHRADPVDWGAAPARYKRYPLAGRVILPWTAASPPADPDLATLSTLLRHLLGLRTTWAYPSSAGSGTGAPPAVAVRRPAPSGGGRYPIEVYPITAAGTGRSAALYHYDAAHHCLDLLRASDHRTALLGLLTAPPPTLPDVVLVLSAVFWRNGFKYREFAYRLQCQETGVLTAQALALAEALNLRATVHLHFDDHHVQALLGLDPTREGPLVILTFTAGQTPHADTRVQASQQPSYGNLIAKPATQPSNPSPSVAELLPHLTALHTAAAHCSSDIPPQPMAPPTSPEPRENTAVQLPHLPRARLADGIPTRVSTPNGYLPTALDLDTLATLLACATAGYPGDLPDTSRTPLSVTLYVLVQRVAGIAPGAYHYQPSTHTLIPVGDPHAIDMLIHARWQPNTRRALPEAAAVLVPVGDPLAGTHQFGDRWYRIQQLEAGLTLHRATLAATARGLTTRIHSDGTNDTTDTTVGLHTTPQRSLSFLLLGHPRRGMTLPGSDSTPLPQPRRN